MNAVIHKTPRKPTPTFSRVAIEPLHDNVLFKEDFKNSREEKELNFFCDRIFGVLLNSSNATFSIKDAVSIASTLGVSISAIRSSFENKTAQLLEQKKIVIVPSLFEEDGVLYRKC